MEHINENTAQMVLSSPEGVAILQSIARNLDERDGLKNVLLSIALRSYIASIEASECDNQTPFVTHGFVLLDAQDALDGLDPGLEKFRQQLTNGLKFNGECKFKVTIEEVSNE